MCGIAGLFCMNRIESTLIEKMVLKIKHRAKDNQSFARLNKNSV